MSKKQLNNYKFYPGVIPPAYNEFPDTVALLEANKDYIIYESTEYLDWLVNTPSYKPSYANSSANGAALLLDNKNFIKEEANAWTASRVVKDTKCKRDLEYLLDGVAWDVALGTNYNAIFLGLAEYNSLDISASVITAINNTKTDVLALGAVSGDATATSRTTAFFNEVLDIAQNGRGAANALTFPDPPTASSSQIAAKNRLVNNRNFLAAEVNAWVASTYPAADHDPAKCERDVKYAIDAICYDILYGGNSATYDQAKFFFYGFSSGSPGIDPTHKAVTVAAYGRLKTIAGQVVRGETVTKTTTGNNPNVLSQSTSGPNASAGDGTIVESLVQITADVVNAESQSAANAVLAGITKTSPSITWATAGLQAAKAAINSAKTTIAANRGGVFADYNYDATKQAKCKRDIGYLVDAFYADLIGGGNAETIRISRMFFLNGDPQLLNIPQEVAVHEFVKDLITQYVLTKTAYTTEQDPVVAAQDIIGATPEALSITRAGELNDIVIDLLNNGLGSLPAISYNYNEQFAKLVYGATKCKRDIDYILKAVAYDISLGTNYNSVFIGLAESNSLDFNADVAAIIEDSKTEVLALPAVDASVTAEGIVASSYAEILDIAENGATAAATVTFTNPTSGRTASQIACKDRILANKDFIIAEVNAWVAANYPSYDHDVSKCSRDVGFLLDALAYDMVYGGNSATYDQAKFFFYTGYSGIATVHKAQTLSGYQRLVDIIDDIVTNTPILVTNTGPTPNTESQDTTGTAADAGDAAVCVTLVEITYDVVDVGLSALDPITRTLPSITWAAAGLQAATNAILAASTTIQNTVVTYSDYTYDEAKCIRDTEYVIDSYIYDLTYGGNSLTYYVASQYQVLGEYTVNKPEVEVTIQTFVKNLILNYILDNVYHPSYQLVYEQTILTDNGEAAGQTQLGVLADIVIDVLDIGISTIPDPVAPDRQNGGLMPNAVFLFEANKRYIQEEAIAFIQYNIDNNIFPFVYFTYNAPKCRRDISYILEGYLRDLKNGGNKQTNFNASKYWENGVAQVDGSRLPEVYTHEFIRDLIENYIWTNIAFSSRQILVSQVIDNSKTVEVFANTRIKELSNTIIQVIEDGLDYIPTQISNLGYIKVPGYFKLKDFLLVTNVSKNEIIFNFADPTLGGEVTYSEETDEDFLGALYGVDKITQLTFDVDTSGMMVTDNIQIFVEGKEQTVRLNSIATDAMERMKVGIPQSMLDADFEYGLQPTKWQAIAQMRNYPSIYEIPGSDTAVTNCVTDASVGTGGVGASLITVTTQSAHGFNVGDPITIKALANTVSGFSRAEGSFLVATVPSPTTFTYYAKSKVGTSDGQVLASSATQLRKGGFYTGAAIGNPTFSVFSSGSSGTVTTNLITPSGSDVIGFTGSAPPLGSPLSGTGITTGAQVTSVTGSGGTVATTKLTVKALIGDTNFTVNSTTGISQGLLINRGDGIGATVTNIVGNVITLSSALTSDILGTSENYTGVSQSATSGVGSGAVFTVARSNSTYSSTVTTTGSRYTAGDTITIPGASLGGTTPTNNATITVVTATSKDSVATFDNGTLLGGQGYSTDSLVTTTSFNRTPKTITVAGNAVASATQYKFGTKSIALDGSGDWIEAASNADFGFGTGTFCIEMWVYRSDTTRTEYIFDSRVSEPQNAPAMYALGSDLIYFVNGAARITGSGALPTNNTWYHVAVSRSGTSTRLWVNGTQVGSTYSDSTSYITAPFRVGARFNGAAAFSGYIDEIRVSKGSARYTTTFAVETSQFVNDEFTVLLIHADSGISDKATGGTGLTVNITASSGPVTLATVVSGGANYEPGDVITIDNPYDVGAVLAGSIASDGSLYTTANNLATTGGSGTGLTVNIVAAAGDIVGVTINNPGQDYQIGDTVTIIGGATRAGVATTTGLVGGSGYANATGLATTSGTGSGCTVNITCFPNGVAGTISISTPGTGYSATTYPTFSEFGGSGLTVSVTVGGSGEILTATIVNGGSGYSVGFIVGVINGSTNNGEVIIDSVIDGKIQSITINAPGDSYTVNDTLTIVQSGGSGGQFTVASVTDYDGTYSITSVAENATIEVATVNAGGAIQSVTTTGTPITAPDVDFVSAFTISEVTTAQIASGNTGITYSAIATLQIVFGTPHGLVPGDTITVAITSSGTGAQLAAGPYFVEQVPNANTIRYTARAAGTIDNTLVGVVYGRPDSFFIHRPFDGGVQLGTASPSHGASALRMSKKYIRYQSGKGVMYNTGALFAPSYDIRSLTATGTTIGSVITVTTDDTDHGCQVGGVIRIEGVLTSGYNGTYTVSDIVSERVLKVVATKTLASTTAEIGSPCYMSIRNWHGSTIRAGIFDDQNGMFWQYDGQRMAVVRRSSTFQLAGTIAINANANTVTGTNTRFLTQLTAGDKVVIRGMTHTITQVASNTTCYVAPDFRGVVNVSDAKMTKVIDLQIPQEDWNLDTLNGAGPSGYNIDVTKMQMIGIQHTWYGAGFIDFMLRGSDGNYVFANRIRNSNVNAEAYMRTGNQPVRYEVTNEGARSKLTANISSSATELPLEDTYWFPDAGTVYVGTELVRYTGRTETSLTGCTRGATLTQFTAGSQRSFTGTTASSHQQYTGVVLVSNTITPNISHWGSAFMIDGQFDSDRGYIFNYTATGLEASVDKNTAFLIRLAPSVSNAIVGDLGEKELLNRAQLLLTGISITSDTGNGGIVIEGVLNPINYPTDPTNIIWSGLGTQAAGGQPSFAQIASGGSVSWQGNVTTSTATVQGAFTTTVTAKSFAPSSQTITAVSFSTISVNLTALWGDQGNTRAIRTNANTIIVTTASLDALTTTISQASQGVVGDLLSATTYLTSGQRIVSIARDVGTFGGIGAYSRITMSANGTANSPLNTDITITLTFQLPTTYASAISTARSDFLITQAQLAGSTIALTDVLSASTRITGGQTISTITANYATIAGTSYARIIMSSAGNSTSGSGTGNNVTVTATSASTALYGSAVSSTRQDFLITTSQFDTSGILVGDSLGATTVITGGQTISAVTRNYINLGGTDYTRIVMSGNGNATSTSGAGNDVTVTVTAAGSQASYVRTNYLFFTSASWIASGAAVNTKVSSSDTNWPAGTAITNITTRTFGATTVYRVTFNQAASATIAAADTVTFQFGALYALPGETVFSFIANPGGTETLDLTELKELTATTIGGRGTFPNGPDVLAINVYKVSGAAVNCNIILRWSEAQA